jgi:LmbE family N-acetylglucosaminyl deacetylase
MRRLVLLGLALAACNEGPVAGPELPSAPNLTVVAHQDDDLLFMQPDLTDLVEDRVGVVNVYVTAGNGRTTGNAAYEVATRRYEGLLKAYAQAAGLVSDWACGVIDLAGHSAEHCRLEGANVSLVFLGYPDGGKEGEMTDSLLRLWEGRSSGGISIGPYPARYDQAGLIDAVAAVITTVKPTTIRTLEIAGTHGRDHSDHMIVAALTLLATAAARSQAELISFRGYGTEDEAENLSDTLIDRSTNLVAHYAACAEGCAVCGNACPSISDAHAVWVRRRYAVGMRRTAHGVLRKDGLCATSNADGPPQLGACSAQATHWELTADGLLRANGRCVGALPTGELVATPACTPDSIRRFFLDDEGHLWLGTPPLPESGMDYAHLMCLGSDGNLVRAGLCGREGAPRWELSELATQTPRPIPALPGRAVRLADLTGDRRADLCYAAAGELHCAAGHGDGTFAAPTTITPLAIEPESLVIGDVDGDRIPDACGRDATGLRCALSTTAYAVVPWSPSFARDGAADATDRSLSASDANGDGIDEICGLDGQGVVCAPRGFGAVTTVRSRWPAPDAPMWSGDLDGDHRADWCVALPGGAACGLDRDRGLTTDGASWTFSQYGVLDTVPADTALGALADIDADGRADLCTIRDRAIVCARSQGHGFGPAATFATLPAGGALSALWLGDLDGDGALDACVEDGATVSCVR